MDGVGLTRNGEGSEYLAGLHINGGEILTQERREGMESRDLLSQVCTNSRWNQVIKRGQLPRKVRFLEGVVLLNGVHNWG